MLAQQQARLEQAAAGVVAAPTAHVSDSVIGVLLARHVDARNVRVLFGLREALALGAAAGAALAVLLRWRAR